jgi:hypothetical protein
MKIKRDISSTAAPSAEQLEVGELAINAKTGILYTKLVDGSVVKYLGSPVGASSANPGVYSPTPVITFSDTTSFCCNGTSLIVTVNNLLVDSIYSYSIVDLTGNSTVSFSQTSAQLFPLNSSQRSAVLNISIGTSQPNATLKFSIYEIVTVGSSTTSIIRSEKLLPICCQNCTG